LPIVSGTLYVVATPIGNLDDLAPRARQTLGTVDRIAAEDTRHTGRLLTHIGVKTPQTALHEFNESAAAKGLVDALLAGESIALVSDAGTPLLSDPGFRLVRAAHDAGVRVVPIPGPSAVVAALSVAGLATDRFCFEGFLPAKSAGRRRRLEALRDESRTLVFFEAVHRVAETLEEMAAVFGPVREATLARELTKLHEEVKRAALGELAAMARDGSLTMKGEFVIVVAGAAVDPAGSVDADTLLKELVAVLPGKQAAAIVARVTGESRNAVYQRMLELKERQ
jgi:16S rRNA (cytidine1402-2'-O)-methyltransferase